MKTNGTILGNYVFAFFPFLLGYMKLIDYLNTGRISISNWGTGMWYEGNHAIGIISLLFIFGTAILLYAIRQHYLYIMKHKN
jgi:hypothetical protein